jgi:hypothetical protein
MKFYDTGCEAHSALKAGVKDFGIEGVQTTYYTPAVTATL